MSDVKPVGSPNGHKRLAIFLVLIISSLLASGFVWSYKSITIAVDNNQLNVKTYHRNVKDVLDQAGIALGPNDEVCLSTQQLTNGTHIQVYRAIPLEIAYQGQTMQVVTGKPTVGEVAVALGIRQDNVVLTPAPDTLTVPNMLIQAVTMSEGLVAEQVAVPAPVVRQADTNLEAGIEQVETEGCAGSKEVTWKQYFADGKLIGSEVVSEQQLALASPTVVRVGTRDTVQTSRGSMRFKRVMYMEATAYNPHDGSDEGITATGIPARHGIVAVDPKVIPMGTRVYIPGYGMALAADTGGAIKGEKIDLCMEGYAEACDFGRRMVKVYVLSN